MKIGSIATNRAYYYSLIKYQLLYTYNLLYLINDKITTIKNLLKNSKKS